MSGPEPEVGATPEGRNRDGRGPAPEMIGAVLAIVVLAVVGTSVLAGGGVSQVSGASPSPLTSTTPVAPSSAPPVDPTVVDLLSALNQRLIDQGTSMQRELDRARLRTAEVATLIRLVNRTAAVGTDVVPKLGGFLGPDQPGGRLGALYVDIAASAGETLGASVRNDAAYRAGAGVLVKHIEELPALQAALEALLSAPPASVAPSGSVAPSPSSSPSPPPATQSPPPSTTPTAPPASGPPIAPDEQLENPNFETGVGPPWTLLVGTGAAATIVPDSTSPANGQTAARVDISTGSSAYSGISLQQAGLQLDAGGRYTVTLSMRSVSSREVRIRIASTVDASYLTRLATTGTAWAPLSFTFIAPVTDPNAVLHVEMGRSTVTTWIDAVSFRPAAAGS